MIKIETSKNFTAPKNESTKTSLTNGESMTNEGADELFEGSEFARVLENLSSRKENGDHQVDATKPKEREKDFHSKTDQHTKDELSAKDKSKTQASSHEDAAGAAGAQINTNDNSMPEGEWSLPPARAIMHIADLERIISSVRSQQTFDGNSQVVITMKNSVYSGLQIKLTTDQNQRVTAEFIAANEKVKAQIDARSGELADLLRQRGVKLTSVQTSVGAETSGENGKQQNSPNFEAQPLSANIQSQGDSANEQISEQSETANTYRV